MEFSVRSGQTGKGHLCVFAFFCSMGKVHFLGSLELILHNSFHSSELDMRSTFVPPRFLLGFFPAAMYKS